MIRDRIRKLLNALGYDIVRNCFPLDMEKQFQTFYQECKDYTVTSVERMYALYKATQYIAMSNISGDIVECGVWKGGSMMLAASILKLLGDTDRRIYLYDTYSDMTEPTEKDIDYKGESAKGKWKEYNTKWCSIMLEDVKRAMYTIGYPQENMHFIKGKVEDTIPGTIPSKIALLRLDTDFYESTYHELLHLYPKLVPDGVLIIDDYGHYMGAREAVDKYFHENDIKILLNRIDYTGRMGIKK